MSKTFWAIIALVLVASVCYAGVGTQLTDKGGNFVTTPTFTPVPSKSFVTAASQAKGTYCTATTSIMRFNAYNSRAGVYYPNTSTTKTFPIAAGTATGVIGVNRAGTGAADTVTQYCFTNVSGASLSFQGQ